MRTGREENIQSKVGNCFYSKALKLFNFMNRRGEKFKIIISSHHKQRLQQEQQMIIKTNKNQIKRKQNKLNKPEQSKITT